MSGLNPYVINVASLLSPFKTGILAAIPSAGVVWYFPPKGISTVPAPIVASNLSTKPFCIDTFNFLNILIHASFTSTSFMLNGYFFGDFTSTSVVCLAPFVSKNSLFKSAMFFPLQIILSLSLSVTSATLTASKFSSAHKFINFFSSSLLTTTAILSCDSEIAISVPSKPSYFLGTLSKSISKPLVNSPIATETPPAPKSLHLFIIFETSELLNNLWIFLSVGGFPFWTSAPHSLIESSVCSLEDPVAPPSPSLPVLPPKRITTSPAFGSSLTTFSFGAAAITAPTSILLAT